MRKIIRIIGIVMLMACFLSACSVVTTTGSGEGNLNSAGTVGKRKVNGGNAGKISKELSIVTTIFPEYDWVREILGEQAEYAEITMLLDNGVDLHSYQPTASDILRISSCDMFVYVGGESDEWVEDVLAEATNKNMVVINLLEVLGDGVKAEEIVEGMEHDHDHDHGDEEHDHDHDHEDGDEDHDHDHDHEDGDEDHNHDHDHEDGDEDHDHDHDHEDGDEDHDHDHEEEMDEHVWLSLRNTAIICEAIADGLAELDENNAKLYQDNAKAYKEKLADLDARYQDVVKDAKVKTLLFGDRFPFRYLVDDYNLSYYAAFAGCSAESEASFETILFLANKTDELGLGAIMTIEGKNHRIAETIRDNTEKKDQKILTLDSMQSTTSKDVDGGVTYLSVMTQNLETLREALK